MVCRYNKNGSATKSSLEEPLSLFKRTMYLYNRLSAARQPSWCVCTFDLPEWSSAQMLSSSPVNIQV